MVSGFMTRAFSDQTFCVCSEYHEYAGIATVEPRSMMLPLAAERAFKLEHSMSREQSAEVIEIYSPGSPGSPVSSAYPRDVLMSPSPSRHSHAEAHGIKMPKPKMPTSSDLARLSMYLTAQQHNKLKQHIQQVGSARWWSWA